MRNLKRVLGLVMAIAMMLSLTVFSASAAFPDQDKIENTEAVDMNVALNIIQGRDTGEFDPEGGVTRAEMAKMICIILNGGNDPSLGQTFTNTFSDTASHWASAYIEYCATLGIVAGMGDGTFNPNGGVTGTQAAKMLLVALGYDASFEQFNGSTWAVKINVRANEADLYDNLSIDPNAALNRDDAAQMIWNALRAQMVKYNYSLTTVNGQLVNLQSLEKRFTSTTTVNDTILTLLIDKFKTDGNCEGVMTGYQWLEKDKKFQYDIYGQKSFKSATDYTGYFGQNVNVVQKTINNTTTVYGMYVVDSQILATGVMDDLDTNSSNGYFEFDGVKYGMDTGTTLTNLQIVAENDWAFDNDGDFDLATYPAAQADQEKLAPYEARLIDVDGDNKVDYVAYLPFAYGEVTNVKSANITVKIDGGALTSGSKTYAFDDNVIYDDAAKEDYVKVVLAENTAYDGNVVTLMPSFDGKVDNVRTDEARVDGTWYTLGNTSVVVDAGAEYTIYAVGSFIYYVSEISGVSIDNVVYIAEVESGSFGVVNAKAYFADGTSGTINVTTLKLWNGTSTDTYKNNAILTNWDTAGSDGIPETKLFTYSAKGSEYTLTEVSENNKVGQKDFTDATAATVTKGSSSSAGTLKIANKTYTFDDSAVVFVETQDGVDIITGAQAKKLKTDISFGYAAVLHNTTSGNPVKVAALYSSTAGELPSSSDSTGNYGLVVAKPGSGKDSDGDTRVTVELYNPATGDTEEYFITDDSVSAGDVPKGSVVMFDIADAENNEIEDVVVLFNDAGAGNPTGTNEDAFLVRVTGTDGRNYVDVNNGTSDFSLDLTSDTKYIFLDSSDVSDYDTTGDIDSAVDGETYFNALVFIDNADDEIALIVVDTMGQISCNGEVGTWND